MLSIACCNLICLKLNDTPVQELEKDRKLTYLVQNAVALAVIGSFIGIMLNWVRNDPTFHYAPSLLRPDTFFELAMLTIIMLVCAVVFSAIEWLIDFCIEKPTRCQEIAIGVFRFITILSTIAIVSGGWLYKSFNKPPMKNLQVSVGPSFAKNLTVRPF